MYQQWYAFMYLSNVSHSEHPLFEIAGSLREMSRLTEGTGGTGAVQEGTQALRHEVEPMA